MVAKLWLVQDWPAEGTHVASSFMRPRPPAPSLEIRFLTASHAEGLLNGMRSRFRATASTCDVYPNQVASLILQTRESH